MGMMTWETFQTVADKVLAYGRTQAIDFAGMGEPTLNPKLPQFIEYFRGRIPTYITTNVSALTTRNIEKLLNAGLSTIIVSYNGADAETYELMMGGLSFTRAENYLHELVRQAKGKMKIVANVSVTRQTQPHLSKIKRYLDDAGVDDISFSKCHSRGGHLKGTGICDTPMPLPGTTRCDIFDNTLFLAWNGDVLACCHDLDGVAKLGNLVTDDIADLDQLKSGLRGKGAIFAMCAACNDMYRFGNDQLPDRQSLSSWVYDFYVAGSEPSAKVVNLLREREAQLQQAEQRASQAEVMAARAQAVQEVEARAAALAKALQEAEARAAAVEQRADKAEALVAAYERGRFIRFMRSAKQWASEVNHLLNL
jgi:hypothetical protein